MKKSLQSVRNYNLCKQWMKIAYKEHKNRIDVTDSDVRLVYQFFYEGEEYPFYVLATHIEHGQIVQLTRHTEKLDDGRNGYVYMSQLATPDMIDGKITMTFDEPQVYTVFAL